MPVTLTSTGIQFPDATVQTTAGISSAPVTSVNGQTGAITTTNLYSIGSFVTGRPSNTADYGVNSTVAGSSLYATSPQYGWVPTTKGGGFGFAAGATLVNTGSWRCVSPAKGGYTTQVNQYQIANASVGLWVRYA